VALNDYKIIGPLCYMGKKGCSSVLCRRLVSRNVDGTHAVSEDCMGYHCSYCDEPCSSQGHRCDAANAILAESRRIMEED